MNNTYDLKYNTAVEVSIKNFGYLKYKYSGILAFKYRSGKFFIKLWIMSYKKEIETFLKSAE